MQKRTTILDVALAAGVSKGVVSAVLSGRRSTIRVSEVRRASVMEAAKRLNYEPSLIARSLHARKSYLLAYICPGGGGTWGISTRILRGLQQSALEHGYSLVVYPADSLEGERENIQAARERQVDGIVLSPLLIGTESNARIYRELQEEGLPVVQIGNLFPGLPSVERDSRGCALEGTRLFLTSGRRRILLIVHDNYGDPLTGHTSHAMYGGYREAMEEAGLVPEVLGVSMNAMQKANTQTYKSLALEYAHGVFGEYLSTHEAPEAILAANNHLAYGAGLCLKEHGIRTPEEVPVISCSDDYVLPPMFFPMLSGFPIDGEALASAAVSLCLGEERPLEARLLRQPYVEKESFRIGG